MVRDARKSELEYIKELRLAAYKEHEHKITDEHWNVLKQQITSGGEMEQGVDYIVAVIDGEIAGSVELFPPKAQLYDGMLEEELDYPELRKLAVSPNFRGKGIAKALIAECIKRTKERRIPVIGLHTADYMEGAIGLYESIGFERRPEHDFEPVDDGVIVKAFQIELV